MRELGWRLGKWSNGNLLYSEFSRLHDRLKTNIGPGLQQGWCGKLMKGTDLSLTDSSQSIQRDYWCRYCRKKKKKIRFISHHLLKWIKIKSTNSENHCPKSMFNSFNKWAGFQKLGSSTALLSVREIWSNIWFQVVVCDMFTERFTSTVYRSLARCSSFCQWKSISNLSWKHWIAGKMRIFQQQLQNLLQLSCK